MEVVVNAWEEFEDELSEHHDSWTSFSSLPLECFSNSKIEFHIFLLEALNKL